jgi:hypothetical protein
MVQDSAFCSGLHRDLYIGLNRRFQRDVLDQNIDILVALMIFAAAVGHVVGLGVWMLGQDSLFIQRIVTQTSTFPGRGPYTYIPLTGSSGR